jgi:hypothetical protein
MDNMELDLEKKIAKKDHLPQSEAEWFETRKFNSEMISIGDYQIRCAFTDGDENSNLIIMSGGIPRDPERRKKLPLINKLYGHLALQLLDHKGSSVLYNQPATGNSTGNWEEDSIKSRTEVLSGVVKYYHDRFGNNPEISIIGTSAAGCMAINSVESLQANGINVKKLILLSPGAYPAEVETLAYGDKFSSILRKPWDIAKSSTFLQLEKYVTNGGSVLISFFEADDPPIPANIQLYYKELAEKLASNGGDIRVETIVGVGHNFRRIGSQESKNIVDNDSIRKTAGLLINFLVGS